MSSLFDQMFPFHFAPKQPDESDNEDNNDDERMSPSPGSVSPPIGSLATSAAAVAANYHPMMMMKMMMLNMEQQQSTLQPQQSLKPPSPSILDNHNNSCSSAELPENPVLPQEPPAPSKSKIRRVTSGCGKEKIFSTNRRLVTSTISGPITPVAAIETGEKFENSPPEALPPPPPAKTENPMYRCHLCSYTGNHKLQFNAHMNTHFDHRCPHCDYTSRTEGRLKRHIRDFHSETPPETWSGNGMLPEEFLAGDIDPADLSDDGLTAGGTGPNPARNRKYRCKQCGYVAVEKRDFWEHTRQHIKTDKMLACPKCNFVTEYKHHLEYHLRNHLGSKPFRCGKCNYSCVNKSMLNSHMKSHSNIYQYRCEDCTYATKYCHSLKLHLRKYEHRPATVLNLDGTPNPYPVIDVYGTRRGPRPKKGPRMGPRASAILSPLKVVGTKVAGKSEIEEQSAAQSLTISPASTESLSEQETAGSDKAMVSPHQSSEAKSKKSEIPSPDASKVTVTSSPVTTLSVLRCNYCPYQTESKADFSAHMFDHVRSEKLTLLQEKRQKMCTAAAAAAAKVADDQANSQAALSFNVDDNRMFAESSSPKQELTASRSPVMSSYSYQQSPPPPQSTSNVWGALPPSLFSIGNAATNNIRWPGAFNSDHFNPLAHFPCTKSSNLASDFHPLHVEVSNRKPLDLSKSSPPPASQAVNLFTLPPASFPFATQTAPNSNVPVHLLGNPAMMQLIVNNLLINAQQNFKEQPLSNGEKIPNVSHKRKTNRTFRFNTSYESDQDQAVGMEKFEYSTSSKASSPAAGEGNFEDATTIEGATYSETSDSMVDEEEEVISSEDELMLPKSATSPPFAQHLLPPTPIKSPKSSEVEFEFPPMAVAATAATAVVDDDNNETPNSNCNLAGMMQMFVQFMQATPGQGMPEDGAAAFNLMQKMYNATSLMQEIMAEMGAIKK